MCGCPPLNPSAWILRRASRIRISAKMRNPREGEGELAHGHQNAVCRARIDDQGRGEGHPPYPHRGAKLKVETDFPDPVIEAIAERVVASLRPLLMRKLEAPDDILTVDQLAEYLGIAKQRVYEAVSKNTIPYFKVGKSLRFRRSVIEKWIESKSVPVAPTCLRPLGIVK